MRKVNKIALWIVSFAMILLSGCVSSPYNKTYNFGSAVQAVGNIMGIKSSSKTALNIKEIDDPYLNSQWAVEMTEADKAWSKVNQKREIKVAVIDTGVDYTHPDLKDRVLTDLGYDFINNKKLAMDDNWHGTHVAGIIAAEANNNTGITGIAGPLDVKIIPIKALDKNGQGFSDVIAKAMVYAVDTGADIINISVNFKVKDNYIEEALKYAKEKGVLVVTSSGNDNVNCDTYSPSGDEDAYTVGAVTQDKERASFSSYGASVKIAAPGVEILSTIPGGKYENRDGTSMAAPVVAGVAAILKAQDPALSPDELEGLINDTAVDVMGNGKNDYMGYGIVNANNALTKLLKK